MKILITGGYGFIGMYAARDLLARGHEVYIFDILSAPPAGLEEEFEGVVPVKGDLLNPLSLLETIKKFDIERIIHLAAFRNNDSRRFPYAAFKLNCEGTVNCLEAARIMGLDRVCYASSIAVLGGFDFYREIGIDPDLIPNDAPLRPTNIYGVTKYFCEMIGREYTNIYGLSVIGVRLPIIFGAGKKSGSRSSFYNDMIEKAAAGEGISVNVVTKEKFNILYVKDAAKAVVCACLADKGVSGVFSTGGEITTMEKYADSIKTVLPGADITLVEDPKASTISDSCMDSSEAAKIIGYTPDYTLRQGIEDYLNILG